MSALTVTHESFTPEFVQWLKNADLDDLYQEYSDAYKEIHGIRPRWCSNNTRDEFARDFISLGNDYRLQAEMEAYEADPLNHPLPNPEWIPADKYEAFAGEPL